MQLGEQIVQEIGLECSNDILGRWLAHHVAELMQDAENAKSSGTPEAAAQAAKQCRTAILQLWQHRSAWPQGWPPPRSVEITKRFNELDEQPFGYWRKEGVLTALQAAHHLLLAAIVDCVIPADEDAVEEEWLARFRNLLSDDEITILERAAATGERLDRLAEVTPEGTDLHQQNSAGHEHPLLKLADAYRDLVVALVTQPAQIEQLDSE